MSSPDQSRQESDERVLTVIPDANVLVHGKALLDLPWGELGRSKIEILFVPPVIRELDKLKNQSGRPNKIARQLSSDVRTLLGEPDRRAEIRKGTPTVTKRVEVRAITTAIHDALKLDHADQALINYALHLRADALDVLLLTDDTICGTTAQEVGLPTQLLPDHWLRESEPDEGMKENARLKAEIRRLTSAEPTVVLSFRDNSGEPLARLEASITRWPELNKGEIDALMDEVRQRCPPATSFEQQAPRATNLLLEPTAARRTVFDRAAFSPYSTYKPPTVEEIERYKTSTYPDWLDSIRAALGSLHEELETRTLWPTVLAVASNGGTRPATDVLLAIRARGRFAILDAENDDDDERANADRKPRAPEPLAFPLPPSPPRGSVKTIGLLSVYGDINNPALDAVLAEAIKFPRFTPPSPRRSDAFYWRTGRRDWGDLMELECASWRHGQQELVFSLKLRPSESTDVAGAIELSVHANNISNLVLTRLPIRICFNNGSTVEEARGLVGRLAWAAHSNGLF